MSVEMDPEDQPLVTGSRFITHTCERQPADVCAPAELYPQVFTPEHASWTGFKSVPDLACFTLTSHCKVVQAVAGDSAGEV